MTASARAPRPGRPHAPWRGSSTRTKRGRQATGSTGPDSGTGGRPEQTALRRRRAGGRRVPGKGLNGADGQGDACQSHDGGHLGRSPRRQEGVGGRPVALLRCRGAQQRRRYGKPCGGASEHRTQSCPMTWRPRLWDFTGRNPKRSVERQLRPTLTAALPTQQDAEGTRSAEGVRGYGRCGPPPQRDVRQPRGTGTRHHCDGTEGPGGHWPGTETRRRTNAAGGHRDESG